jgi:hypothetical protein
MHSMAWRRRDNDVERARARSSGRALLALAVGLATGSLQAQPPAHADGDTQCVSASGRYRVGYSSDLQPLAINRIHSWVLHIETTEGDPVTGAEIEIDGGMPEHDHGLATSPRATEELGGGDYRVEGLRFHMPGEWEIVVSLRIGADRDRCTLSLVL